MEDEFDDEDDTGEVVPFKIYLDPFPEDIAKHVHQWLKGKFSFGGSWKLDEFLVAAEDEGFSALERQCVAYATVPQFSRQRKPIPGHAGTSGRLVHFRYCAGRQPALRPKGAA